MVWRHSAADEPPLTVSPLPPLLHRPSPCIRPPKAHLDAVWLVLVLALVHGKRIVHQIPQYLHARQLAGEDGRAQQAQHVLPLQGAHLRQGAAAAAGRTERQGDVAAGAAGSVATGVGGRPRGRGCCTTLFWRRTGAATAAGTVAKASSQPRLRPTVSPCPASMRLTSASAATGLSATASISRSWCSMSAERGSELPPGPSTADRSGAASRPPLTSWATARAGPSSAAWRHGSSRGSAAATGRRKAGRYLPSRSGWASSCAGGQSVEQVRGRGEG